MRARLSVLILTGLGVGLGVVALLLAWADSTPVASLAETRPAALGAALAALGLLVLRLWRRGRSIVTLAGLVLALVGVVCIVYLLNFAYRSEELVVEASEARVAGTLYLPREEGPHPVAIFLHGSGESTRGEALFHAKLLARNDVAAFVYDKRGSGESGGELWVPYDVYAADAAAVFEAVARHPEIDPSRVGYFGHSEGAWVAPLAARRTGCAFIVATGATHLSPAEQVLYELVGQVRDAGFDAATVERASELWVEVQAHERSGVAADGLDERLRAASAEPWAQAAELPSELASPEAYAWWRSVMDFDPRPHWREVDCPVLLMSGGRDTRTDVAASHRGIEQAVPRGTEVTSVIFPDADHMVLEWPWGENIPPPRWPPTYRQTLLAWLHAHL